MKNFQYAYLLLVAVILVNTPVYSDEVLVFSGYPKITENSGEIEDPHRNLFIKKYGDDVPLISKEILLNLGNDFQYFWLGPLNGSGGCKFGFLRYSPSSSEVGKVISAKKITLMRQGQVDGDLAKGLHELFKNYQHLGRGVEIQGEKFLSSAAMTVSSNGKVVKFSGLFFKGGWNEKFLTIFKYLAKKDDDEKMIELVDFFNNSVDKLLKDKKIFRGRDWMSMSVREFYDTEDHSISCSFFL